jgi:hypothetical protein
MQWSRQGASHSGLRPKQHTCFPFEPTHRFDIGLRHKLDNEPMSVHGTSVRIDVSILSLPDLHRNTAHCAGESSQYQGQSILITTVNATM